jgi:hypothetical protein
LDKSQVLLRLQHFLHPDAVLLLVHLGSWAPHGRTAAGIQEPELDTNCVGYLTHHAAKGIHLSNHMSLCDPANRGITRHLSNKVNVHRHQCGP